MTQDSYQWNASRVNQRKPARIYEVDQMTSIAAQVSALLKQLEAMSQTCEPPDPDRPDTVRRRDPNQPFGRRCLTLIDNPTRN